MEFGLFLRLVGVMNPVLTLSCFISIPGREPNLEDFICRKKDPLMLTCIQHLHINFFQTSCDDRLY